MRRCAAGGARSARSSIEGAAADGGTADLDDQQRIDVGVRPGTAVVGRDRERAAARRSPAAPPAARRHLQLPHRPRRRHRQRPARRADERGVRGARRLPAGRAAGSPARGADRRGDGRVGAAPSRPPEPDGRRRGGVPTAARTRQFTDERLERHLCRHGDAAHQSGRRAGRPRARRARHHGADPARDGARGAARAARAVGEARVARAVRRRHRARDEQPAAGRPRPPRAAHRHVGGGPPGPPRRSGASTRKADRAAKIVRNLLVFTGSRRMCAARHAPRAASSSRALASRSAARWRERHRGLARPGRRPAGHRRGPAAAAAGVSEHPDQRGARRSSATAGPGRIETSIDERRADRSHGPADDSRHRPGHPGRDRCRASSIRSSRRRTSARARGSGWRSPTGLSRSTAARSTPPIRRKEAPSFVIEFPRSCRNPAGADGSKGKLAARRAKA